MTTRALPRRSMVPDSAATAPPAPIRATAWTDVQHGPADPPSSVHRAVPRTGLAGTSCGRRASRTGPRGRAPATPGRPGTGYACAVQKRQGLPARARTELARLRRRHLGRLRGVPDPHELVREGLVLGEDVYFGHSVVIDPGFPWLVTIGDRAVLAPRCHILAHDGSTRKAVGYTRIARVHIGAGAFIGADSLILPGVTVGDGAVVGAGSIVRRDVPAGVVVAGNPATEVMDAERYFDRHRAELEHRPVFSRAYTVKEDVSHAKRQEMRERLADGPGYVK